MIKVETLGMIDVAKVNPVLTHTEDVKNYSFLTKDEDLYLVANTLTGDNSCKEDCVIKKGEVRNLLLMVNTFKMIYLVLMLMMLLKHKKMVL